MKQALPYTLLLLIFTALTLPADVVINEFVADNETLLQDEDGDFSDWIELKNTTSSAINLSGWHLTDDPSNLTKWVFPSTIIPADGFLVVFASNKNRAVSGSELHTNFGLSKNGEYLALVNPDGSTIASEYTPSFPAQIEDLSYGLAGSINKITLVGEEAPCSALVPTRADTTFGASWHLVGFDDMLWDTGQTGVGYDEATTYDSLINLDVEAEMNNTNATVYIRVPFTVTSISDIVALDLRMKYDDGFVAFLNGVQVASENPPATALTYNSNASAQQLDGPAQIFEDFDISAYSDELVVGDNILAIHGLNRNSTSSDMLIVPELTYTIADQTGVATPAFLESPTPGAENTGERAGTSAPVEFSALSGVYSSSFQVTLTSDSSNIYYTLDGSEPTTSSDLYTGPITINSTTALRAKSSEPGLTLGTTGSEQYIFLNPNVTSFSSNLPVIVIDSFGQNEISNTEKESSHLAFFEPGVDGRTFLNDDYTLGSRAGIRRRGETSLRDTDNKPNLAIESWGPDVDEDTNIAPLGMPAESDWVLWGPYSRDLAGLRNAFIYELSNQTENYAVRTRFVEVFLNVSGGDVSMADYAGFYVFMEKIKRDKNRVDVESLAATDNSEPKVTGGYILRIDKSDPNQNSLTGMTQGRMYAEYPRPEDITTQQEDYISDYIIDFEAQLSNPDPVTGYPSYIDVGSFVDHNLFNMMTKNSDGLYFSTYMSKARGGKLAMSPLWDFDRSVDSALESRDDETTGWNAGSTPYIEYNSGRHWWGLLFQNADFWQAYVDRWQDLRLDTFSDSHIADILDGMGAEVAEARARDITKWGLNPRNGDNGLDGTQQGEVNYMKWWLSARMTWIDSQLIPAPTFSQSTASTTESFQLTINALSADPVYYTLDGSDPRAPGGTLSASAMLYSSPITVLPDSIVLARAWNGNAWAGDPLVDTPWSGLATGVYYQEDLLLTEVHYNPREPDSPSTFSGDDFEFIEFQNTGSTTLDLTGYVVEGGISFSFLGGAVSSLAPGEFVVVVKDQAAFASRYNTAGMNIAGSYTGQLANSGENVRLEFYGEQIYDILYDDARGWPCQSDGGGHSLVPMTNEISQQGYDILDYWGNWRASFYLDGSPGENDPTPTQSITVNEVIANTDTGNAAPFDSNDVIEFYNPTTTTIILDGSWYLSNEVSDPEKWNIPSGTVIAPGAWVAFDEDDFHPARDNVGFGLDEAGERVVLSHRPGGGFDRVVECIDFHGQANGSSWGRYPDGDPHFQALTPTSGSANQLAGSGVQITELMYNPPTLLGTDTEDLLEYILLHNTSASTLVLEDLVDNSGTWRIAGGVDYAFDNGVSMSAGEEIWLVPFDPILEPQKKEFFCVYYGLNAGLVRLLGPYSGDLSNSGDRITVERPQASGVLEMGEPSWIIVDEAVWLDEAPWPPAADGTGLALLRIGTAGSNPQSWSITSTGDLYNDRLVYDKVSPGTSSWNAFTSIPKLSDSDYADANSLNGATASIVAGTLNPSGATAASLLNGSGQINRNNPSGSVSFTDPYSIARILIDLQSVQSVHQLTTYSWHSSVFQNQGYDLYYSADSVSPDASSVGAANSVSLVANGWIPLGSANTNFSTDTIGQIGACWNLTSAPINTRYLLFDIHTPDTYFGEIDILTGVQFVINGVPKTWLSSYGLPETDAAALLDSDKDGQRNWEEYQAGTNPLDPASVFKVTDVQHLGETLLLTWNALEGKTYSIQYKEDLEDAKWTTIQSEVPGISPEKNMSIPLGSTKGFIRITVDSH